MKKQGCTAKLKKLTVNRETLRTLEAGQILRAAGGTHWSNSNCESVCDFCTN